MTNSTKLSGLTILNTRPKKQAEILSKDINSAGGHVIECPTIDIFPVNTLPSFSAKKFTTAIFTSRYAVDFMPIAIFDWLQHQRVNIIAIGPKTAEILKQRGIDVHEIAKEASSESLAHSSYLRYLNNQSIVIFKGEGGRDHLESTLRSQGADVFILNTYKRLCPNKLPISCQTLWKNQHKLIILATSVESVHNFFTLFGDYGQQLISSSIWLAISKRVESTLREYNEKQVILSHPNTFTYDLLNIKEKIGSHQ